MWLGSQDPDAQRFKAARTIAADHLAGVFGGRSETACTRSMRLSASSKTTRQRSKLDSIRSSKATRYSRRPGLSEQPGATQKKGHTDKHQQSDAPPNITSKDEYDKLKSGSIYLEDGKRYRKP
jgi:hypothetical protein